RALNGYPEVGAKTRATVEATAKRMGYRPNRVAQKLQSGRSGLVGMIVHPDPALPKDRSFVEVMLGLSQELAARDLDLLFQVAADPDLLTPYRRLIEMQTVDGFLLNAPRRDDPRVAYLRQMQVPFVVHGRDSDQADYAYYDIDNAAVAQMSTDLLLDLGHRRIALLNGPAPRSYAQDRHAAFKACLTARGGLYQPQLVIHDDQGPDFAYRSALAMLSERFGSRPTALLCATTVMAEGVLRAASDLGLAVPTDLSVVAHDDGVPDLWPTRVPPSLTVTRAPLRAACAPLARLLVEALDGAPASQITARVDMIVRASTGPAPSPHR
ncbi:MAG: substrate-binding domain-containing protein, partial [Paracoccaceae bacterium]